MGGLDAIVARLRSSTTVAGLLDAGFDAFEAIRLACRACEDREPELFAAFMMAAGAAVEGRNALAGAPSLPSTRRGPRLTAPLVSQAGDVDRIADELADLAGLLADRLRAAPQAAGPGDRAACHQAAGAASQIRLVLARNPS